MEKRDGCACAVLTEARRDANASAKTVVQGHKVVRICLDNTEIQRRGTLVPIVQKFTDHLLVGVVHRVVPSRIEDETQRNCRQSATRGRKRRDAPTYPVRRTRAACYAAR